MANEVPNLDCAWINSADYFAFHDRYKTGLNAKELFPDGGKGTRRATASLARYASFKGCAIDCRLRGDIECALYYEHVCETIYSRLPEFSRW